MRSQDIEFEHCCECDAHTGYAGRGEDSLYAGSRGPYCDDCWGEVPDKLAEECDALKASLADTKAQLANREGWQLVPVEAINFLFGVGSLDGVWFGEQHPSARPFWWRLYIANMLSAVTDNTEDAK